MPRPPTVTALMPVAVLLLAAIASTRCGSASTSVLAPSAQRCTLTVSPQNATASAAGGTGSFTITTARECQWAINTPAPWILLGLDHGQGSGSIPYEIEANRSTESRADVVAIGDLKATVTQQAATCAFSASPSVLAVGPAGGDVTVSLSTDDFCRWATASQAPWITAPSRDGTGGADIRVHVDANTGGSRHGVISLGPVDVAIDQGAAVVPCKIAVSPAGPASVPFTGSTLDLSLTGQGECEWTAQSSQSWITVGPAAGNSTSGTVRLTIQQNSGAARSGVATVAGQTITVNQGAAPPPPPSPPPSLPCVYTVSPASYNAPLAGGSLQVTVTAGDGCNWTVSGVPAWASANRAGGTGNGQVTLSVSANGGSSRNAVMTIATQPLTLTQPAAPVCSYAISPTNASVPSTGANIVVSITTTPGCAWTASGNPAWINVSLANGSGSGTTTLSVFINSGAARNGSVQIAGGVFTVTQQAPPACTYSVSPASFTVSKAAQTKTIAVSTQSGCSVDATSTDAWVHVLHTPPPGGGDVTFSVDKNPASAPRTGQVTVYGPSFSQPIPIYQDNK